MTNRVADAVALLAKSGFVAGPADDRALEAAQLRGVPACLLDFYRIANGLFAVEGDDFPCPDGLRYRFQIVPVQCLKTVAEYGFAPQDSPLFNCLKRWWQFFDCGDSNWVGITDVDDGCRIVDLFHETVGDPGSHAVIAHSLPEFLEKFAALKEMYWLSEHNDNREYL